MPRQRSCGGLRHEDVETDLLAGGLDPCGDVHGVADGRIVEAGLGTHVPDAGKSGVYSDADANLLLAAEAEGVAGIEAGKRLAHGQRGANRFAAVIGDIDRGIPEGHDRVPDELVERAFVRR